MSTFGGRERPPAAVMTPLPVFAFRLPPPKKTFRRQMGAKNDSKKGRGKGVVLSFSFELELSHFPDFFPRLLWFQEMGGDKKISILQFWLPPLRTCMEEVGNYTCHRQKC